MDGGNKWQQRQTEIEKVSKSTPSITDKKDKNKLVIEQMSPVDIHAVLFTANDIYDGIDEYLPQEQKYLLDEFEKSFGQRRNNYWNGQWDGNQLKAIVQEKNLNKMEQILPKEVQPFIKSLTLIESVLRM